MKFSQLIPGAVSVLMTSRHHTLPWVRHDQCAAVESFSEQEVEQVFRSFLGNSAVDQHRRHLMDFANGVERLPIAINVWGPNCCESNLDRSPGPRKS